MTKEETETKEEVSKSPSEDVNNTLCVVASLPVAPTEGVVAKPSPTGGLFVSSRFSRGD